MSKNPKITEEDKNRTHHRITQIIDQVSLLFRVAVIGGFVFLTACAIFYWPVQVSVGKETTITVAQSVIGDFKIDVVLAWRRLLSVARHGAMPNEKPSCESVKKKTIG